MQCPARAVSHILFASPFFAKAHNVACYLHMAKGELRTDLIVEEALNQGRPMHFPFYHDSRVDGQT